MYNLLLQDKIYEACEILAKYDFDFEVKADGNGVMNRIYNYFPKNEDGYNALADKMQKSKENYQTYYRLFEQYQESYYYTKVLLQYTRRIGSNKDKILLYHYLRSWEEKNNAHPITKFETLCNRMTDLMEIASDIDFRNMIREVDKCLEKHKQEIYEMEMICPVFMRSYYISKSNCLILLREFEECIEFLKRVESYCVNDLLLENLAYCYYRLSDFDHAGTYCAAALNMDNKESAIKLMAKIHMGQGRYEDAIRLLIELIARLREHWDGQIVEGATKDGKRYKLLLTGDRNLTLETPYQLLVQAYIATNQLAKAKAVYLEMQDSIGEYESTIYSGIMLAVDTQLVDKKEEVEEACKQLQEEVSKAQTRNERYESMMQELSRKLVACQVLDDEIDISDDYWEEHVAAGMNAVIEELRKKEKQTSAKEYENILAKVQKQFPGLDVKAQKFFASAEQIYQTFLDNSIVDYAPVMVEYCKVVDVALWNYLDNSREYRDEVNRCLNSGKQKTLGSGAWIVSDSMNKSLWKYADVLHQIKRLRNNSAHVNVSRRPDVEWIRSILWEESDLLKVLSGK